MCACVCVKETEKRGKREERERECVCVCEWMCARRCVQEWVCVRERVSEQVCVCGGVWRHVCLDFGMPWNWRRCPWIKYGNMESLRRVGNGHFNESSKISRASRGGSQRDKSVRKRTNQSCRGRLVSSGPLGPQGGSRPLGSRNSVTSAAHGTHAGPSDMHLLQRSRLRGDLRATRPVGALGPWNFCIRENRPDSTSRHFRETFILLEEKKTTWYESPRFSLFRLRTCSVSVLVSVPPQWIPDYLLTPSPSGAVYPRDSSRPTHSKHTAQKTREIPTTMTYGSVLRLWSGLVLLVLMTLGYSGANPLRPPAPAHGPAHHSSSNPNTVHFDNGQCFSQVYDVDNCPGEWAVRMRMCW